MIIAPPWAISSLAPKWSACAWVLMTILTGLALTFAIAALSLLSGCDNGKVAASGNVRYAGEPVNDGLIELIPTDGTPGGSCGTRIVDGKYEVAASAGLKRGGVYKVVLRGFRKQMQPDPTNPSHQVEVSENYLPADWGEQSTHRVEVGTDGSPAHFDFDL